MTVVYDSGVLIAADRNDRRIWADHRVRLEAGLEPIVTAPVVAQASRSPRQAALHRFIRGCKVVPFAPDDAHAVGTLLSKSQTSDVVDAHVVVAASRGDRIVLTGDAGDLRHLAMHVRPKVEVRPISGPGKL